MEGNPLPSQSRSHHRRNAKAHKVREGKLRFVLGRDIFMDRIEALCSHALIGRLEYTQMGKNNWQAWAAENWKPLFSYTPTISLLAKGWLVIVFLEEAHALSVLNSLWRIREGSLVLDRWHINFDPLRERVKKDICGSFFLDYHSLCGIVR